MLPLRALLAPVFVVPQVQSARAQLETPSSSPLQAQQALGLPESRKLEVLPVPLQQLEVSGSGQEPEPRPQAMSEVLQMSTELALLRRERALAPLPPTLRPSVVGRGYCHSDSGANKERSAAM